MPNPIPIVPLTDFVCVIVLLFLNVHLWKRVKESPIPSLKAFFWFFVSFLVLMFTLSLPGLFMQNPYSVQAVLNFSTVFFFLTAALFVRFITICINSSSRLFLSVVPLLLIIFGVVIFIWQMNTFAPSDYIVLNPTSNTPFILYTDNTPALSRVIVGIVGFMVYGVGAALFIRNGFRMQNSTLRRRSFLIGFGCMAGVITNVFNSIFYVFSQAVILFFFASIIVLLIFILIYISILSR